MIAQARPIPLFMGRGTPGVEPWDDLSDLRVGHETQLLIHEGKYSDDHLRLIQPAPDGSNPALTIRSSEEDRFLLACIAVTLHSESPFTVFDIGFPICCMFGDLPALNVGSVWSVELTAQVARYPPAPDPLLAPHEDRFWNVVSSLGLIRRWRIDAIEAFAAGGVGWTPVDGVVGASLSERADILPTEHYLMCTPLA